MNIQLTSEDYGRLVAATVACHVCMVPRGVTCRNPETGKTWSIGTMHADRRVVFQYWRKSHPEKYQALRRQLLLRAMAMAAMDISYETMTD